MIMTILKMIKLILRMILILEESLDLKISPGFVFVCMGGV